MGSFRCYDSSNVIATLMMTNFHLNTTDVAIFPNVCLWRRSLCSDLVLTLKNCIEPPSYARTAYVVAIWPSFHFDSFIKIWATCEIFLGKWFTAPLWQKNSRTPMVLAALHFNYNLRRETKVDDQGQPRLHISYPKYKEGEATVREVRVATNYGKSLVRTIVAKYTCKFPSWTTLK